MNEKSSRLSLYKILLKTGRFIVAFPVLIWLTGCVTSSVNLVPPYSKNTPLAENQGIVVARVVNAGAIVLPINFVTIAPKNLNESEEILPTRLEAVSKVPGDSTIFASAVDAGEYSLSSLRSYHSGYERWYSRWVNSDVKLGTFKVEPGKITDLGTLIYYSKPDGDVFQDILLRSPSPLNSNIVDQFAPAVDYHNHNPLTWNDDSGEENRRASYSSVVQNPTSYKTAYKAPDGSIYFIGNLGFIIKRTPTGDWEQDAVDTDFDLVAVAQNKRGDLLVGGEFGNLYLKKSGENWQKVQLAPKYLVEEIWFQDENTVDLILRTAEKIEIRRADISRKSPEWDLLAKYSYYLGWRDGEGNSQNVGKHTTTSLKSKLISSAKFVSSEASDYMYLSSQTGSDFSIFNHSENHAFSVDTQNWTFSEPEGVAAEVDYVIDAGAIDLGVKRPGFFSWEGINSYFRYDSESSNWVEVSGTKDNCPSLHRTQRECVKNGKRYRRYSRFNFISVPVFFDDKDGIAIVKYRSDLAEDKEYILKTQDGGETWKDTGLSLPSEYCIATVPQASEDVLLLGCNGVTGDFYESYDRGETWEHVREHQNF